MRCTKGIFIIFLIALLLIPFFSAVSNVQHSVDGNVVILTYQGTPPFLVNIRDDSRIGEAGGYLLAKTNNNFFVYDLGYTPESSRTFYYGVKDTNWGNVNSFTMAKDRITVEGNYTKFYNFPKSFFEGASLTPQEVVKVTDKIYLVEGKLHNGVFPTPRGPINQPSFQVINYQASVYGSSGFPMILGDAAFPAKNEGDPSWDVIAHEMSHNFWNAENFFYTLARPGPFLQESTSVLTAEYTYQMIKANTSHYGLSTEAFNSMQRVFLQEREYQKSRYEEYVRLGNPYSQDESGLNYAVLTSQALDYKMFMIGDTYGWEKFSRFNQAFSSDLKENFTFWKDGVSDAEETTYTIAALNVAFGRDFRSEFKNLNFPIDDNFYSQIYPVIKGYVD